MDKVDANIISKICSEYCAQYELLTSTQSDEENLIKRAWDIEKQDFYSGNSKRFNSTKEIDTYYYMQMVGLLKRVMKCEPELYKKCTGELNKILKKNSAYSKKAGLIVNLDDKYSNTEYYVNYIFAEKALDKCKAIIGSYGTK